MLEGEGDSPSKTFIGVRFVLFGFDPVVEHKVRSKLVGCGGVDVGHYSPKDCSHVIVDKIVYDDPICVAARNDAKTLVTALWVHDSFDVGMPLDPTSIIYRPLKDLNGIPDAKSLIVCLTGYQRQDRDDIMTMVSLMGAQFSKPLVANKVTHLICYKFEGEKYDLAKKLTRIKMVNHHWLEDCLRDWALLPEDNYKKSGYEMEMMEAEAKDSEDEAENTLVKQSGVRSMYKSPQNMKTGSPATSRLPKSEGEVPQVPMNFDNAMGNLSIPQNENKLDPASSFSSAYVSKGLSCQDMAENTFVKQSGVRSMYESPQNENKLDPASSFSSAYVSKGLSCQDMAENTFVKQSGVRSMYESPHNMKICSPATSALPKSDGEVPKVSMNFDNAMCNKSIHWKENKLDQTSSFYSAYVSKGLSCQDPNKFQDATDGELNDQHHRTPDAQVRHKLTSNSGTAERPAHSAGNLSYSRQTPSKPTLAQYEADKISDGNVSEVSICKLNANNDVASSNFIVDLANDNNDSNCVEVPLKGTHVQNGEESGGIWPRKRTMNLSHASSKSQKMSHDAKSGIIRSPSSSEKSPEVQQASLIDGSYVNTTHYIVRNDDRSPHKAANLNDVENSSSGVLPTKSSTFIQKASACHLPFSATVILEMGQDGNTNKKTPLTTFQRLRKSSLSRKPGIADCVVEKSTAAVRETVELQNQNQVVEGSSPNNNMSVPNNSNDSASLNSLTGGSNHSVTKPLKKMISKKTLGSRLKVSSANQKGSVYSDEDASLNDTTAHLNAGDCEKSPGGITLDMFSPDVNAEALKEVEGKDVTMSADVENNIESIDDETEAPEEESEHKLQNVHNETKAIGLKSTSECVTMEEKSEGVKHILDHFDACVHDGAMASWQNTEGNEREKTVTDKSSVLVESTSEGDAVNVKKKKGKKRASGKTKLKTVAVTEVMKPKKAVCVEDARNEDIGETEKEREKRLSGLLGKSECCGAPKNKLENSSEMKENRPIVYGDHIVDKDKLQVRKSTVKSNISPLKINQTSVEISTSSSVPEGKVSSKVKIEPVWFILSGERFQRKEFQQVIRRLKGRCCRDSHHWSYQATHFIAPDPIRRIEKFFAAAASGRWILKSDYLAASKQAGRFLAEEPYEWYKNGLSEDGAINLEAPRKWRLLRERTGHGAFHGMRIIIYGECIAPRLDTLKRVVKAGDGTILATSPPYTRFLNSGVDFAIVSPEKARADMWVEELLKHEIPCVVADYLVEYVCKPGYPLERHVLHNTHAWAEKSFGRLQSRAEEVVEEGFTAEDNSGTSDIACVVCGSGERGEVMLICGNESGSVGCGIGTHIDCCNPPLEDVPEDDWFCPKCSPSKSSISSSKKRKKGKSK